MKWLQSVFDWLANKFSGCRFRKRYISDLPDTPEDNVIYIVGEGSYQWFVAMKCPCGCGELLQLSLEEDSSPRWDLTEHADGSISLHPSVWRNKRCLAHFWVKKSNIEWCRGTGVIAPSKSSSSFV